MSRKLFTKFEDECISLCYRCTDLSIFSKFLDRSEASVKNRAYRLGIRHRVSLCPESLYFKALAEEAKKYDLSPATVLRGKSKRLHAFIRASAFKRLRDEGYSCSAIGRVSGYDNSSIIHMTRRLPQLRKLFNPVRKENLT
jgi:hypothetical protein